MTPHDAEVDRFAGFADVYDAHRPSAPQALGPLLVAYAGTPAPDVVDLGSGTGLSTRWAAEWAGSVVGVEPSNDMRQQAESRPMPLVAYRHGTSSHTGLDAACAHVVMAVQAMHWMEPVGTLHEVARILRPGGVFAVIDADWPPVTGVVGAEAAWQRFHRRIRVFEARAARGETGDRLRLPIDDDDPALIDEDLRDPHRNRAMPGGVQSWSKREHLGRMQQSRHFAFTREIVFDQPAGGGAERFIGLMRSQGSYQALRRVGLEDDEMGATQFEHEVQDAYARMPAGLAAPVSFSWRVRLGVTRGGNA